MTKKGFTLIELLAVIVILAIIALIATPMILGVIDSAKKGAAENSTYGYIDAIEKSNLLGMIEKDSNSSKKDGEYNLETIGIVSYKGNKPKEICVIIDGGIVISGSFQFDNYIVDYENGKAKVNGGKTKIDCNTALSRTILYTPFDNIGNTIPSEMLLYFSANSIENNDSTLSLNLIDSVSNEAFNIMSGSVKASSEIVKTGNSSAYFSGETGQRINIKNSNLNFGTKDFTISFWLNPETTSKQWSNVFSTDVPNQSGGLRFFIKSGLQMTMLSGTTSLMNITKSYTPNVWAHYAVVRKDGVFTVYENGMQISVNSDNKDLSINLSDFSIGGSSLSGREYKGYIDDFAIYSYAKYINNFTPPTVDAVSDPININNNQLVITDVITGKNFTVLGDANLIGVDSIKKFGEASLYFPGTTNQRINIKNSNLNFGTKDFTIGFWLNPETTSKQWSNVFSTDIYNQNGDLRFFIKSGLQMTMLSGTTSLMSITKLYTPNVWIHYAVVRKDGVFTVYENGMQISVNSDNKDLNINLTDLSIGGSSLSGREYKGYIDDFVIYSYAKYTNEFTPPQSAEEVS